VYTATFFNGQPYMSLNVIASALCLSTSLVEDLAMAKDYNGTLEIVNDEIMIPFDIFKRIRFPQDEYFFKIAAAYLKKKCERKNRKGDKTHYG